VFRFVWISERGGEGRVEGGRGRGGGGEKREKEGEREGDPHAEVEIGRKGQRKRRYSGYPIVRVKQGCCCDVVSENCEWPEIRLSIAM